ncbi:hypothetical protein [Agrococcus jejuensis]|nr:hypothetical protein [Agrococcus jejuensis]
MVVVLLLGAALMAPGFIGLRAIYDDPSPIVSTLFTVLPVAYLVVSIAVIVDAVRRMQRGTTRTLVQAIVAVKAAGVVFLCLAAGFSVLVATTMFHLHPPTGILVTIGLVVLLTVLMVPTSLYGIAGVVRLRRLGAVGGGLAAVLALMHLVLVTDLVASIIVARMLHVAPSAPQPDPRQEWEAFQRLQQRPE